MRTLRYLAPLYLWAIASSVASAAPISVVDSFGRRVSVPAPPQRIVTIFSSNTEIVAALGLTDRIVGIDGMTHYPPSVVHLPVMGNRLGFSVDAVADQRPDLVIVTPSRQAVNQLLDPMTRLGVPVLILQQRSVAEVLQNIRTVATLCGAPQRGRTLSDELQARLDAVARARPTRVPSVVMITGTAGDGLLLVAQPDTYTWDAVQLAGGRYAFKRAALLPQVSPEAILQADPDVLLYAGSQRALNELVRSPGWRDLRAVRTHRAFTVERSQFLIPGPRTVQGVEDLAQRLFPTEHRAASPHGAGVRPVQ